MKIPPRPPVGSLIAYEFLWASQARSGDEARKVYPCAVVLAVAKHNLSDLTYVLGISHSAPREGQYALPMPLALKRHLGLDDLPAWIYLDQVNIFEWVGSDVRPAGHVSRNPKAWDSCVIGRLPTDWFDLLRDEFFKVYEAGQVMPIKRQD